MSLKAEIIAIMIIGGIFGIFTTINSVAVYADTTTVGCDPTLWAHVYHPTRLHTLKTCMTVSGIIDHIKREPDGDLHIRVHLDPQYSNLTNSANDQIQAGDLVIEPVCDHEPTQSTAAIEACSGFQSQIAIPPEGTHIQTTGRYVLDTSPSHGWTEIHPVSDITDLDSSPSALSIFGIHTAQPLQQHIIPSQRQHVPYDDIPDKSE
jgi:hypothetical protein